ncbi:hypothetical protein P9A10_16095 [Serratia marcescens]|uniref:hypothetical protein n=1 Tax=Serratia marcescens TaxID=615 RepID=UPI003204D39C
MLYVIVFSLIYAAILSGVTTLAGIVLNLAFFKGGPPTKSTVIMILCVAFLVMFVVCAQVMPIDTGYIGYAVTSILSMFTLYKTIDV